MLNTMLLSSLGHQPPIHHGAIWGIIDRQYFGLEVSCSTTRTARKIGFIGSRVVLLPLPGGTNWVSYFYTAQHLSSFYLLHELANCLCILPDFRPCQQQLDSPIICSQSFRIEYPMHKFMAASKKPSNAVRPPSRAPPSFSSQSSDGAGNEMMSR